MHVLKFIVANNILRLRTDAEMSRTELGEKIHYTEDYILRWERAESMPDEDAVRALAEAFGVTPDYLLNPHDEWVSKEEKEYLQNTASSAPIIETKNFRAKEAVQEKKEEQELPKKAKSKKPAVFAALMCFFALLLVFWGQGMLPKTDNATSAETTGGHDGNYTYPPNAPFDPENSIGSVGGADHVHEYREYWEIAYLQTPYENGEERKYCYNCEGYLYRPIYASTQGLFFENHGDGTCTVTDVGSASEESGEGFNLGLEIIVVPPYINDGDEVLKVVAVGDNFLSSLGASHETIREVKLPDTVERIGSHAFVPCTALEKVNIPYGVTEIGEYAFSGCTSLNTIEIPDTVTRIGNGAFEGCTNLRDFRCNGDIGEIPYNIFKDCINLESAYFAHANIVCESAFENCESLVNFDAEGLSHIERWAFKGCISLSDVYFSHSVSYVGEGAFYGCISLNSAKFEEGGEMLSIENEAFRGCKTLYGIELPARVTRIGAYAFADCYELNHARIKASEIGECAFWDCEALEVLELGDGVRYIGNSAFESCRTLKEIKIPEGVVRIDSKAFYDCTSVTYLEINASLDEIDPEAVLGCEKITSVNLCDINASGYISVLNGLSGMTHLTIKNGVIPGNAFQGLTNLVFAELGVTEIGGYAFWECPLETLVLYDTVKRIGECAFYGTNISELHLSGNIEAIDSGAFESNASLENVYINGDIAETGINVFRGCTALTHIELGNKLAEIGEGMFEGCTKLEKIMIVDSVKSIGSYAFKDCVSLKYIYYEGTYDEWESIEKGEFWNENLTDYYIYTK